MAVLPPLTFANITWSVLFFIVSSILYKFIIQPLLYLLHYKTQGGKVIFYWELIPYIRNLGNAYRYGNFYHTYNEVLRKDPNAKFVAENFGPNVNLILLDTAMAKDFLMRHEVYERDWNTVGAFKDLIADSGVLAKGKAWKKLRRIVASSLNFDIVKMMTPTIVDTTQETFSKWIKEDKIGKRDLADDFAVLTGEIAGRVIFGKKFGEHTMNGMTVSHAIQVIQNTIFMELFTPSIFTIIFGPGFYKTNFLERHRKINKDIADVRAKCKELIKDTQLNGKKEKNLMWALLEQSKNPEEGEEEGLDENEILGVFIGLVLGGTESASHVISSALYFLWKYPEIFAKVKEEVDKVVVDPHCLDLDAVNKMEYMTCVVKETLRMGGPIGALMPRVATQDDNLCGVKIKKGTFVNYFNAVFYYSEKYYSKPMEFIPERWLPNGPYSQDGNRNDPYAYLPFAAGPRNCLGQIYGFLEVKIILSLFIKTFDYEFRPGYNMLLIQRPGYVPSEPRLVNLKPKNEALIH